MTQVLGNYILHHHFMKIIHGKKDKICIPYKHVTAVYTLDYELIWGSHELLFFFVFILRHLFYRVFTGYSYS